jgi:hypothetical protein
MHTYYVDITGDGFRLMLQEADGWSYPLATYATMKEAARAADKLIRKYGGTLSPMLATAKR